MKYKEGDRVVIRPSAEIVTITGTAPEGNYWFRRDGQRKESTAGEHYFRPVEPEDLAHHEKNASRIAAAEPEDDAWDTYGGDVPIARDEP